MPTMSDEIDQAGRKQWDAVVDTSCPESLAAMLREALPLPAETVVLIGLIWARARRQVRT